MARRYQERAENNEVLRKMDLVNGFKYPEVPVIVGEKLKLMNWGLIPFWAKDETIRQYTLNAKAETIFEKPSFKNRIATHRCLVPATGYFEWQHNGKIKQPWFIRLKEQDSFSFAAVWDAWKNPVTGSTSLSFTIITTEANPLLAEIHNSKRRMPVVLTVENEFDWLKNGLSKQDITDFFKPPAQEYFEAYPIRSFNRDLEIQENITQKL